MVDLEILELSYATIYKGSQGKRHIFLINS
jgi:hypothetical protein